MRHIRSYHGYAVCDDGSLILHTDMVDAAMESDCDACRVKLGISGIAERRCEVKPVLVYEEQPELLDRNGKPYERDKT